MNEVKREKVINIIGLGWSGQDAPFDNGERWGINCSYIYGKLDKVFWLHKPEIIPQSLRMGKYTQDIPEILNKYPDMDIVSLAEFNIEAHPDNDKFVRFNIDPNGTVTGMNILKKTTKYPLDEACSLMGWPYFTSSVCYLIAMAILEGADRIRLYGIDAFSGTWESEYKFERQGIEHWVMLAKGKGIKVEVPFMAMITAMNGTNNLYGYHEQHFGAKV